MHIHQHHNIFLRTELNSIFTSLALRLFAFSLITVFIPIYLIKLGYSIQTVFLFFMVASAAHALTAYPAAKLAAKFGYKHLMVLSTPFSILFYLMLHSLEKITAAGITVLIIPIIGGISFCLYWVGYHADFAKSTKNKSAGKAIGSAKIVGSLAVALGPITGAYLLTKTDFATVFLISIMILVLSMIPLLLRKDKHEKINLSIIEGIKKSKFKRKDTIASAGYGIELAIASVVWPVYIFYNILDQKFTTLGLLYTISLLFSILVTYIVSRKIDKKINLFYRASIIINTIIWSIKIFLKSTIGVFIADSVHNASKTTTNMGFNKFCYSNARKKQTLCYIATREFTLNSAYSLTFLTLSFMTSYFWMFMLAILGSLMFLVYKK
ncbi:MFS transporter [archaeon]|jgi:MFS family permease|nr:MFS transporter [archaeon]